MHNTPDSKPRASRRKPVPIDLGLQGGGAHGAFTWGVLDRLLDEPWLQFDGISGTSAGAMNAAVMASGYVHGGADGAKAALATFWKSMSDAARFSPIQRGPLEMLTGKWTLEHSPMYLATEMLSRIFSPYELNPLGTHPLRPSAQAAAATPPAATMIMVQRSATVSQPSSSLNIDTSTIPGLPPILPAGGRIRSDGR